MEKFRLRRTKQCAKCPWRKDVDPFDIPNGYDPEKHKALESTIATDVFSSFGQTNLMACHESKEGDEDMCVGWMINQLGPGNNIGLRLKMYRCENMSEVEVFGEQHQRFEDTLPQEIEW